MLQLVEIFASIQGESTFAGLPCIFIRLAGCNLRCHYCDTKYSYQPKFSLTVDDILKKIKQYAPIRLVEITGGEPLLQTEIYDLMKRLQSENYQVLLETNGSLSVKKVPNDVHKIVDVKCPQAGNESSFLTENLQYLDKEKDELKFVLSDQNDYEWAKSFIEKNRLREYKILFSCVFSSLKPKLLAEWMVKDKVPFRLQLQLHKYIWHPDEQGV
jgi:7-carboxy-7-deazaguanine synthase